MSEETAIVAVRYPHSVVARAKGERLSRKVVSGVAPVRFRVADPADAPVAFVVERDFCPRNPIHDRTLRGRLTSRVRQRFVYRTVDDRLLRSMLGPDDAAPLTVESLAGAGDRFWRDHPGSKVDGRFPWLLYDRGREYRVPEEARDRDAAAFLESTDDFGPAALLKLFRVVESMRVVDGVLYREAPPPCWTYDAEPTPTISVAVLDFDNVAFQDSDDAHRFDESGWIRRHSLRVDPRVAGADVLAAFSRKPAGPGGVNADRSSIETRDESAFPEGHFDLENLRFIGAMVLGAKPNILAAPEDPIDAFRAAYRAGLSDPESRREALSACFSAMEGFKDAYRRALAPDGLVHRDMSPSERVRVERFQLFLQGATEVAVLEAALRARLDGVGALAP